MRFTVIGAGFAALTAVKTLRKLAKDAEITVVAPQAELVYLPSIIWLPAGLRTAEDLKVNLTNFFKKMRVNFIAGRVQGIYDGGRSVHTEDDVIHNDALIIASGGPMFEFVFNIECLLRQQGRRDQRSAFTDRRIRSFRGHPS